MKLIIVESPTKCETIKRYLGKDYIVMASKGHIQDLATKGKGGLGVDVEHDFKATYTSDAKQKQTIKELQLAMKKVDEVILATDPDREGEAIAWHLTQVLKLDVKTTKRLEFHEITRESVLNAIEHPRHIDMNLVASQETRRILDRIIGFKLSNLLLKKIKSHSAGRVQSATLKIIADHDEEIKAFVPEEYWKILVDADIDGKTFALDYKGLTNGELAKVSNETEAKLVVDKILSDVIVTKVKKEIKTKASKEPFITSTLQQDAFNKFKYKTSKTQSIAQKLYEGLSLKDEHVGLITYMRTDSTRLSDTFIERAKNYINETFGKEYVGFKKTRKKDNELSQDAHEAIRPTANHRTPHSLKPYLSKDEYNIYKLIYDRAIASLMAPKKEEITTVTLESNGVVFALEGKRTVFEGYEAIYHFEEEYQPNIELPKIEEGEKFKIVKKEKEQAFTQPPSRYSEAKVVKIMEEVGIGRPSTYASTIAILQKRKYVSDTGGILVSTEQGWTTVHVLDKYFPDIVNAKYTASMEEKLDNIVDGSESQVKILCDFYTPFIKEVESANKIMYVTPPVETGEMCPLCGAPLVERDGKHGKFIGCSNYPTCKYIKKEPKVPPVETGEMCPLCGKPLVYRHNKKGKEFIGCSGYPTCHYIKPDPVVEVKKCPKCGGSLFEKKGKKGTSFLGCSNYPTCDYIEKMPKVKGK
ncbi:MAG: type I DNA topoisomerase [Erysipelotrichaceae bacterium]|jgi:DNA topoisomerase-1|nr:type I DNA topoisomerase [Erysipelotrichaceae bacterium]